MLREVFQLKQQFRKQIQVVQLLLKLYIELLRKIILKFYIVCLTLTKSLIDY